jgi:thymidylate synthase
MALTYDAYSKTVKSQQDKESEFQLLKDKYQQDMKAIRQEIRREMKEQLAQLVSQLKPEVNKRRIILRHRYPILCHKNLHSIQLLS